MTGRPMTAAEQWADDADAAVAGSNWRCVDFLTSPHSADVVGLYQHEVTHTHRRVKLSAALFCEPFQRIREIVRQLGLDQGPRPDEKPHA
jgi:hypothetical protein